MFERTYKSFVITASNKLSPDDGSPLPIAQVKAVEIINHGLTVKPYEEVLFEGGIKWDGCSDIDYGYMHFCDATSIYDFNKCLMIAHELAQELLTTNMRHVEIDIYDFDDLIQLDKEGYGEE